MVYQWILWPLLAEVLVASVADDDAVIRALQQEVVSVLRASWLTGHDASRVARVGIPCLRLGEIVSAARASSALPRDRGLLVVGLAGRAHGYIHQNASRICSEIPLVKPQSMVTTKSTRPIFRRFIISQGLAQRSRGWTFQRSFSLWRADREARWRMVSQ